MRAAVGALTPSSCCRAVRNGGARANSLPVRHSILFLLFLQCFPASGLLAAQNPADLPSQVGPTLSAPPFSRDEKFEYRIVQSFGLRGFLGAGMGAGIGQATNTPSEWGQGTEGFAKRYGSSFATNLSRQSMAFVLEETLHEDPRYFPSEEKGFRARLKNVLLQTVVTRTDSGAERFAYSRVISAFGTGQLVNAWQPHSTGGAGDGVLRGLIMLGGDAGYNFLQEFVPWMRPRSLRHR